MTTDRRELADWERAECKGLKEAIADYNASVPKEQRFTQERLAAELGMAQGNLNGHLNGKRPISKEMAARIAVLTGIPVEAYSPRLAREIAQLAKSIGEPAISSETEGLGVNGSVLAKLKGKATPRSLDVLRRIEKAALEGRLKEADLVALEGIAARFEELNSN